MKISTKGQYSLKAMVDLALNSENNLQTISQIAERTQISETYLEQLLPKLRNAGLVESIRGAQGGYRLAKPLDQITAGEILRAGEGDLIPVECAATSADLTCPNEETCVTKYVWKRITESINEAVDGITLADLKELHK
ncbi:MAG: Rrf2 family transcriptional regulator [Clostridiales bacterium]|nr:Rrf2 family transcriptional regulator [Bacillota bacterium]MCR5004759.1 Rrf2 family transcriptional regulator [Clostridiales bacterium]